jgi:hypothetical protein
VGNEKSFFNVDGLDGVGSKIFETQDSPWGSRGVVLRSGRVAQGRGKKAGAGWGAAGTSEGSGRAGGEGEGVS